MQDMRKWCCLLILTFLLSGCGMQTQESERLKDLDFTVMDLYICVGYGEQDTSGYSIAVEDLYLTDNAICVDTELLGPGKGETTTAAVTCPYIVLKLEYLDKSVVFE